MMSDEDEIGSAATEVRKFRTALQGVGEKQRIATLGESRAAVDRVIAAARKVVRIFERDLSDPGYRDPARIELLQSFILAGRRNRVEIVLHDVGGLERDCARLMALFRRHAHAFAINHTVDAARDATDALVIADEHSFWHRLHQDQPSAVFALGDGGSATPLARRFEEIWESSEPAVSATVLGL